MKNILWIVIVVIVIGIILFVFRGGDTGTLVLQITDAPPGVNITSVLVSLSNIEVHFAKGGDNQSESDSNNETINGKWFVVVEGPVNYNLIEIKDATEFLGSKELPAGKYTQIRLNVDSAKAVIDGDEYDLEIPSERIKIIRNFDIVKGETATLTLDFDAEESINREGRGQYKMQPAIKLIIGRE